MSVSTGFAAGLRARAAFVHVACTDHLTLMHTGDRSAKTIDAGGVLAQLGAGQVLVRDGPTEQLPKISFSSLLEVDARTVRSWCVAGGKPGADS